MQLPLPAPWLASLLNRLPLLQRHPRPTAALGLLALVLSVLVAAPALGQDDDKTENKTKGPDPAAVEAMVERLKGALKSKKTQERLEALLAAVDVPHDDVARAVARALKDDEVEVRRSALSTLGLMEVDGALNSLHAFAKSARKDLKRDNDTHIALMKAIGRHGSVTSLETLTDQLFRDPVPEVVHARITCIGNIRSKDSVEALFDLMKATDPRRAQGYFRSFRVSLMMLTGEDHGLEQERWKAWWRKNKRKFQVAKEEPRLPKDMQRAWERFWGRPATYERQTDRKKRGQDPEDGGR